jgi:hypothetical protein
VTGYFYRIYEFIEIFRYYMIASACGNTHTETTVEFQILDASNLSPKEKHMPLVVLVRFKMNTEFGRKRGTIR